MDDRYGTDVLAPGWRESGTKPVPKVPADIDLVVEVAGDGFCGAITRREAGTVELEDYRGRRRLFPMGRGFLIDGAPVELVVPQAAPQGRRRTASGSFAVADQRARVALPHRILVEGVAVEFLEGVDRLPDLLRDEPPGPDRRYGVLVDHLVPGSKEQRIAAGIERGPHGRHLLIVGHPFIDVWQCVKPASVGIPAWPEVPKGEDWKKGVCRRLGWPHAEQADTARAWQHILSRVTTFRDVEPALLGRVEELIDFVTGPA